MHAESINLGLQEKKELLIICALRFQPIHQWALNPTQEIDQENIASYICGNAFSKLTRH